MGQNAVGRRLAGGNLSVLEVVHWVGHGRDRTRKCLKKRGSDVRQARRMVPDRSEWRGFVRGTARGVARGMNP